MKSKFSLAASLGCFRCPKHLHSLCRHLSVDFTVNIVNVVMLLLVVVIAIVLFVASEIWFIVDTSIALVRMKLCQLGVKNNKMTMTQ